MNAETLNLFKAFQINAKNDGEQAVEYLERQIAHFEKAFPDFSITLEGDNDGSTLLVLTNLRTGFRNSRYAYSMDGRNLAWSLGEFVNVMERTLLVAFNRSDDELF